jgi:hypothetical protein
MDMLMIVYSKLMSKTKLTKEDGGNIAGVYSNIYCECPTCHGKNEYRGGWPTYVQTFPCPNPNHKKYYPSQSKHEGMKKKNKADMVPYKKTEWEKKVREPLAYVQKWVTRLIDETARHSPGYTPGERQVVLMNLNKINTELRVAKLILKEDVLPLLHQRDNEIREKIYDFYMKQHGEKLKAWNLILDDIFTLFTNK